MNLMYKIIDCSLITTVSNVLVTFLTVALLVFSTQAFSRVGWMNVHLGSNHMQPDYIQDGKSQKYNEKNFGLGLALPITSNLDVLTGFFENSYNKSSAYAGVNFHTADNYGFSAGINAGLVTGYDGTPNTDNKVILMLVPHLTYAIKEYRIEVGLIPSAGIENRTSVITYTMGTKF